MGAAAYNRGSACLSRQIDAEQPSDIDVLISDLNAMPKQVGAPRPFGPIRFQAGHGGWWAECPVNGSGFWFSSLRSAVSAFSVVVTSYADGVFGAEVC